jgi:hypothetical protein
MLKLITPQGGVEYLAPAAIIRISAGDLPGETMVTLLSGYRLRIAGTPDDIVMRRADVLRNEQIGILRRVGDDVGDGQGRDVRKMGW